MCLITSMHPVPEVDLAEAVTEQLKEAEELEWSDAALAERSYDTAT